MLSPDEEGSALYLYPADDSNTPVFNFALARVRYVGLIGANNVRVFFRLFQAQTTSGVYDYPRARRTAARRTIPTGSRSRWPASAESSTSRCRSSRCRGSTRPTQGMDKQTDSRSAGGQVLGNVQHITAHPDGSEVDTFFGCWLDINQPT